MTPFECASSSFGWEGASVPDDLTVCLESDDATTDVYVSARDVLIAYCYARERRATEAVLGTNLAAEFVPDDDTVGFQSGPVRVELSFEAATAELRSLLADVFAELDATGPEGRRASELEAIQATLDDRGVDCDVVALYRDLVDR